MSTPADVGDAATATAATATAAAAPDNDGAITRASTAAAAAVRRSNKSEKSHNSHSNRSSSLRSSSGHQSSSLTFFRSILGQHRNAANVGYHADAPAPPPQVDGDTNNVQDNETGEERRGTTSGGGRVLGRASFRRTNVMMMTGSGGANTTAGGNNNVNRASSSSIPSLHEEGGGGGARASTTTRNSSWHNCCCNCVSKLLPSTHQRKHWAAACLASKTWRIILCFFTIMLLFGPECRELFFPQQADMAFDVIFMCGFVIFCFDICMRIDVEPNYFVMCNWFSRCRQRRRGGQQMVDANGDVIMMNGGGGGGVSWPTCGSLQCGSFIFWCELASTCSLLFEISFIDKKAFQEEYINIGLDQFGIPTAGMQDVNESSPVELQEMDLLITIAKTVRVARFIRSSTAVKISSKVNWYWFFNAVNPVWWWNSCRSRITRKRNKREQVRMSELASENMGGGGGGGGVGDILDRKLLRRKSWGGIGLSALSAAKAAKEAQDEEKKKDGLIKSTCKMALRYVGLLPPGNDQWKRHLAATKIQRAWRRVLEQRKVEESLSQHLDFAWKQSSRSAMNPERSAMARSMTRQRAVRKSNKFRASSNHPHHLDPSRRGNVSVGKRRSESQVGSAMRELTGQRVAIGIIIALVLTVLFTYTEDDATRPATMIVLYNQTGNAAFANMSLEAARQSSIPDLFQYKLADNSTRYYTPLTGEPSTNLREKEILRIQISGQNGTTVGLFANKDEVQQQALISLLSTVFIILVWIFGVTAFAGPVMILVVIPIERMVRLLGMLMLDPLGYQSTSRYKKFVSEEDEFTKNTRWTKDVLKGMETSFLMLTIRRIGSLMKVGFGSAGVEIIRNNLEKGHSKNMLILTEKGSNVSCIFLFCDIRQFTDATECLQEEVFVFTNRVAAVVHSICHSYGGSANKNIGDAFLLSWQLEEDDEMCLVQNGFRSSAAEGDNFVAKNNQADKALLSVVKICMALHHNDYYLEKLSEHARKALLNKLAGRSGPVVQLGFGLHAGSAVQGAIGSQRKIDATYVSESVERAEDLEGWTKTYGVKMLMSDSFCRLLHPSNRRRCRKIDQLVIRNEDGEDDEAEDDPPLLELWTFDMDIDALWRNKPGSGKGKSDAGHESDTESTEKGSRREIMRMPTSGRNLSAGGGILKGSGRRRSLRSGSGKDILGGDEHSDAGMIPLGPNHQGGGTTSQGVGGANNDEGDNGGSGAPQLTLPTGPALYNANVWVSEEMRRIRELYSDGIFFQKFNSGFQSYYSRDWEHARQCFVTILERFEDGPSRYFLTQIEKNNGKPPRDFRGYGTA